MAHVLRKSFSVFEMACETGRLPSRSQTDCSDGWWCCEQGRQVNLNIGANGTEDARTDAAPAARFHCIALRSTVTLNTFRKVRRVPSDVFVSKALKVFIISAKFHVARTEKKKKKEKRHALAKDGRPTFKTPNRSLLRETARHTLQHGSVIICELPLLCTTSATLTRAYARQRRRRCERASQCRDLTSISWHSFEMWSFWTRWAQL